jgi:hypothetical protein
MGILRERLILGDGGQSELRSNGARAAAVVARLAGGELPAGLIVPGGLAPADLIAALAITALGDDESMGLTLVQTPAPYPAIFKSLTEPVWAKVFPGAPHRSRLCLVAGLLQVHDFWDASHDAAQRADDMGERDFSAFWHGIAHRREPDAGNAAYWFRRVGKHPTFKPLGEEARRLLDQHGDPALAARLIPSGAWNASAMIDFCTSAKAGSANEAIARRLQRVEMWLLLEATFAAL